MLTRYLRRVLDTGVDVDRARTMNPEPGAGYARSERAAAS